MPMFRTHVRPGTRLRGWPLAAFVICTLTGCGAAKPAEVAQAIAGRRQTGGKVAMLNCTTGNQVFLMVRHEEGGFVYTILLNK